MQTDEDGFNALSIGTCFPDACSESNITLIFAKVIPNTIGTTVSCPKQFVDWKLQDVFAL